MALKACIGLGSGEKSPLSRVRMRRPDGTLQPPTAIQMPLLLLLLFVVLVTNGVVAVVLVDVIMLFWLAANNILLGVTALFAIICIIRHPGVEPISRKGQEGVTGFCNKCGVHTLHGTRHCSLCNKCIDEFDHHCEIMGACIGERNYEFYIATIICCTIFTASSFAYSVVSYILVSTSEGQYKTALTRALLLCILLLLLLNTFMLLVDWLQYTSHRMGLTLQQWGEKQMRMTQDTVEKEKRPLLPPADAACPVPLAKAESGSYIAQWAAYVKGHHVRQIPGMVVSLVGQDWDEHPEGGEEASSTNLSK